MPRARRKLAESKARELIPSGAPRPPVNVHELAVRLGAQVRERDLTPDLSGLVQRRGDRVVIGLNASHPRRRRRFTLAHEIGHYLLGHGDTVVDTVRRRDERSALGIDVDEIEANAFAAELLMPEMWLRGDVDLRPLDALDDDRIAELADRYDVSEQSMTLRLTNIGLLKS